MIGTLKTLAIVGSVAAASAVAVQPAHADRWSFGIGVNVRPAYRPYYYAPPVYYRPYIAPAPVYYAPRYYAPAYCPPPVVYSPAPVYYSAPVVYRNYYPSYYSQPSLSIGFGYFGGSRWYGGWHGGGNWGGGWHGGGHWGRR
jgi:hypothetical protein